MLVESILKNLTEGVKYYLDDRPTDNSERFIASEIIREKALWLLQEEIPHGIAIVIERFEDKGKIVEIDVNLICEKNSHKSIILGHGGSMLKNIGKSSRVDIEKMLGKKVFMNIWVKVKPDWRQKISQITEFGYDKNNI